MAVVADLTKAELSAKILDADLKTWWELTPDLPDKLTLAELFSKLLNAAYVAQVAKNAAQNPAPVVGERLSAYPAPTAGAVSIDPGTGIQTFLNTCTVQTRVAANSDIAVANLA